MSKMSLLELLSRGGFVVVLSVLSQDQLVSLREANLRTTALARAGKWPNARTVLKQFPPWNVPEGSNPAENGIWGVQLLMHPFLPDHELFTRTYFSSAVIDPSKELLQYEDEGLVMELFNLLVRLDRDFELRWHRDDISVDASAEEELERIGAASVARAMESGFV